MSKGVFYERHNPDVCQTGEEIFCSSDPANGDKLGGERTSGSDRRDPNRLRVGGVLYCVDGGSIGIDRVTRSGDGEAAMAFRAGASSADGVRRV